MRKDVVKKLRKARALVAKGWCQKFLWVPDEVHGKPEAFCAIGACVWSGLIDKSLLYALVPDENVPKFNDRRSTTQADVVALFDWAIGIEMAGGL